MTQREMRFGDIARHQDINVAGGIIPIDFEPEVTGPGPVFGETILGGNCIENVISVRLGEEFKTSIARVKVVRRSVWRQRPGV